MAPGADLSETLVGLRIRQGKNLGRSRPEWGKALQHLKQMVEGQRHMPPAPQGRAA
jgi:hypothetical protein